MTEHIQSPPPTRNSQANGQPSSSSSGKKPVFQLRDRVFEKLLEAFRQMNKDDDSVPVGISGKSEIQNLDQIFTKIVQRVTALTQSSTGVMERLTLELFPEGLGQLNVEISVIGQQLVDISFFAETEIKKTLRNHLFKLENELSKEGIKANITIKDSQH